MIIRLTFFFLFSALVLHAQIRIPRHVGVEEGLVQSQVVSMLFDRDGYLWIGTLGGLSRWDGVHFKNFGSREGLTSIAILSIGEGPDGSLYMGTSTGGLHTYRQGQFSNFSTEQGLSSPTVRAFQIEQNRWLVGTDNGLNIVTWSDQGQPRIETYCAGNRISSVLRTDDSTILIANYDEGLFELRNGIVRRLFAEKPILRRGLRQIRRLADGRILVLNENQGAAILQGSDVEEVFFNDELKKYRQICFFEDSGGDWYFGGINAGVLMIRDGRVDHLGLKQGLSNEQVTAMAESPSGQITIGTWGGLHFYDHDRIRTFNTTTGLSANIILSITQDKDEAMLFGSNEGTIDRLVGNHVEALPGWQKQSSVWALYSPDGQDLFVGTHNNGAFQRISGSWKQYIAELGDDRVYSILRARAGAIYFATRQGVTVLREGKFNALLRGNSLRRDFYYAICERKNGDFLFGTRQGVIVSRYDGLDTLDRQDGMIDEHVWSIKEGPDDGLYVGTNAGGLHVFKNGKLSIYNMDSGLSDNTVYGVEFDSRGRCYLATNKGVNVLTFDPSGVRVRVIRKADGLASDECSQGAVFKDGTGKLWFGTIGGVSCIDPEKESASGTVPRVHITRFRVFENDVRFESLQPNHLFDYNENYLKFDFVGINFSAPDRVLYRYRMSGVDKSWVETDRDFVQYSNLNDGSYVFELMASNEWGQWSDPLQFNFSIKPPFWETWWFLLLMTLTIGGTIAYVLFTKFQQALAVERLRSKIAADFHDTIGAGLTQVHVLSQVAVAQADRKDDLLKHLQSIDTVSKTLYEEMRDIVWLINPKKDTLYDLLIRLQESNEDLLNESDITFEMTNLKDLDKVRLPMEHRQQIYMIFKEALNNSFKYSRCDAIKLDVEAQAGTLNIVYTDNGVGFDPATVKRGNGLNNMEERATSIGGFIEMETAQGQGMKLTLRIKT